MEKFLLLKLVIILIFMMKCYSASLADYDDDDIEKCEHILVCKVSAEILAIAAQTLQIEEKLSENFISAFLHNVLSSFAGRNNEIAETFISLLNEFKPYMEQLIDSEIQSNYEQLKHSYEKIIKEEVNQLEKEVINKSEETIKSFEMLISETNEIYSKIVNKDFQNAQIEIVNLIVELEHVFNNSQIKNEMKILVMKCNEISKSLVRMDFENVESEMQQFMTEIQSFYNRMIKIENQKNRSEIKKIINEVQKFIKDLMKDSFSELTQKISGKIKDLAFKIETSTMKSEWNEGKELLSVIHRVFDILTKSGLKDSKLLKFELKKCVLEIIKLIKNDFHKIQAFYQTLIKENLIISDLKTFFEKLFNHKTEENSINEIINSKKVDSNKQIQQIDKDFEPIKSNSQQIAAAKVDSQQVEAKNIEFDMQKLASDVKHFYEFMLRQNMFSQDNKVTHVAETNYEIENFIRQMQKCLEVLNVYKDNSLENQLMELKMKAMIDDARKFYERTIKCEISGEKMTQSEFQPFFKEVQELNENLKILNHVDYYIEINDEDDSETTTQLNNSEEESSESQITNIDLATTTQMSYETSTEPLYYSNDAAATTQEDPSSEITHFSTSLNNSISDFESFIKNFNENSCTHADMENLQLKISKLIILRGEISGRNMQMEIDKQVERGKHLLERTRENYLKNYNRLQQLMNIVKEKMSEELVYRGDMAALDKHVEEINALLPRIEVNYQIAVNSWLNTYQDFKNLMKERNAAMIRLKEIANEVKEGNFTNSDHQEVKAEIKAIGKIFKNSAYSKIIEVLYNKINLILKANEMLNIADKILRESKKDFQLNLEQIYTVKQKILVILKTTKNIATKQRAAELYQELIEKLGAHEADIMDKLMNVDANLSHLEALDLEELKVLAENLRSISKSVDNEQIMLKVDKLLMQIREIERKFSEIKNELQVIENSLSIPSHDNDLNHLKSYLAVLADLSRFREPTILSKVKELDTSIRQLIYDYQVKNELQEINRELVNIEDAQTGSDINDNIMRLQNLEIKIEEIEADDETEDDVQEVLNNIHQMKQALPLKTTQQQSAKLLKVIVEEILSIIKRIMSQIVDLGNRLPPNKSHFERLSNETNQIAMDMENIRQKLVSLHLPETTTEEIILEHNGSSTAAIIDQLLSLNNLLNDPQTSALYESTVKNAMSLERVENALNETFESVEQLMNENAASTAAPVTVSNEKSANESDLLKAMPDETTVATALEIATESELF